MPLNTSADAIRQLTARMEDIERRIANIGHHLTMLEIEEELRDLADEIEESADE